MLEIVLCMLIDGHTDLQEIAQLLAVLVLGVSDVGPFLKSLA